LKFWTIGLLAYQFREAQEAAEPGIHIGSTQAKSVDRRGFLYDPELLTGLNLASKVARSSP
jgi:hypothetical protein